MWNYAVLLQKWFNELVLLFQLVFRAIRTARSVNSQGRRSPSVACLAPLPCSRITIRSSGSLQLVAGLYLCSSKSAPLNSSRYAPHSLKLFLLGRSYVELRQTSTKNG
jgi:hypothetical protein